MSRRVYELPIDLTPRQAELRAWCEEMNKVGILAPNWIQAGDWMAKKLWSDWRDCETVCMERRWFKRYGHDKPDSEIVFAATERPGVKGKWDVCVVGTTTEG